MTYDLAYARQTALAIIILGPVFPPDMVRDCWAFIQRLKRNQVRNKAQD